MSWLLINKIIRPPIVIKIANYFQHGAGLERDLRSRIKAQHSTFFLMSFFIIMSPIMVLTWLALTKQKIWYVKNNFSSNHSRFFFCSGDETSSIKNGSEWIDRSCLGLSLSLSYNTWVVLLNGYSLMGVEFRTKKIQCDPPNLVMWNNPFSYMSRYIYMYVHHTVLKFANSRS